MGMMTCSDHDKGIYASCYEMYSDLQPEPEPRWGWIMIVVMALVIIFVIDSINDYRRQR